MIEDFFADPSHKICRFLLGFDFNQRLLDTYSRFSKYDTQLTRFGDSAIIIRKTFFDELGGFENRETFEDVEFLKRAFHFGRINILNASVTSSSRRFIQNGIIKKQLVNLLIFIGYFLNVNSQTLSRMVNKKLKNRTDSIIIFVRFPRKGQVKTRLAETTSSEFALNFYKLCAENLIRNIKKVPAVNRFIFYSNKKEKTEIINWLGNKFLFASQEGDDLGSRMKSAFEKVFSVGSQKVIIVGTDIPDLSKEIIMKAFEMLDSYDVVIGPAKDGGYYLLGMKKMNSELFEKIEYSTFSVLSETMTKIEELNLAYHLLPELNDIDTEDDLINWLNHDYNNSIKRDVKLVYKPA